MVLLTDVSYLLRHISPLRYLQVHRLHSVNHCLRGPLCQRLADALMYASFGSLHSPAELQ